MYAIIVTGGKQYRVEQGDIVYIEKLDGPTAFAGTDAALPASASRAEFVEKTAAWNETVKEALERREHPEKNEKNPE